jgi:hypothetical protein
MITRQLGLITASVLAAAFLAACSSSTTSEPAGAGTTTSVSAKATATTSASVKATGTNAALCTSAANLKTSLHDLKNVNVRQNGTSAVSAQLTKIEQQLQTLKADAHGQYSAQIDSLSTALSGLKASLSAAGSQPNSTTLAAVGSSVAAVYTAGTALVTAVSSTC